MTDLDLTIPALPRVEAATAAHLARLAPDFRPLAEELLAASLRTGYPLGIVQSRRTKNDQFKLFTQGRTLKRGTWVITDPALVVTYAEDCADSAHGCVCGRVHPEGEGCARAIDVCFLLDGRVVGPRPGKGNDSWDADLPWLWLGELGESIGCEWGGRFKFADLGHFQQPHWRRLRDAALRSTT